jgi:hypothetical protein
MGKQTPRFKGPITFTTTILVFSFPAETDQKYLYMLPLLRKINRWEKYFSSTRLLFFFKKRSTRLVVGVQQQPDFFFFFPKDTPA